MFRSPHGGCSRPGLGAGAIRVLIMFAIVVVSLGRVHEQPAAAEVIDNTYINAPYDVSFTWDDSWFLVEEHNEPEFNGVVISDGLAYCTVFSGGDLGIGPEAFLVSLVGEIRSDPSISNFLPMYDENGQAIRHSEPGRVMAAFTYDFTDDDGEVYPLARYIEVRVDAGNAYGVFMAEVLASNFEAERPGLELLLTTFQVGPPEPIVLGEPAPAFVSGQWRISVSQVAVSRTFPDLELKNKTDKEWALVMLDVTNWSAKDAVLSAREFTILSTGAEKPAKVARKVMAPVALVLGTTPFADDLTLSVNADETVRVTIVFSIPADSASISLNHGDTAFPLDDARTELDLDTIQNPPASPKFATGELVSASDGRTVRIKMEGESKSTRFRLLGVDPPSDDSCFAAFAESLIDDLADATVLVEEDEAITTAKLPGRYVWLIGADGQRRLLNQKLIAVGFANADELPADARFGTWFAVSESNAREADAGLWAGCAPSTPTPKPTSTATPKPTATATATPKPSATATGTPKPSATATATPKPSATATATRTPTPTSTPKPVHSSPTPKPSPTKSAGMQIAAREGGHG